MAKSQFELKAPRNVNYSATVVELKQFVEIPKANSVKVALIFGNSVIVSKSAQAGDVGLFFPAETQLNAEFISHNNLYRKPEHGNINPDVKGGYFEQHGRVKAVKFLGQKSEGFFIPINALDYLGFGLVTILGDTFDRIGEHEICRKYVPKRNKVGGGAGKPGYIKARVSLEDQIAPNQFRFHADTENLRRNIHKIQPDDYISISDKWHGTSFVAGKVVTLRQLPWYERMLKRIGVKVQEQEVGHVYSSRRVIKAVNGQKKASNHYYSSDIWGVVAREIEEHIPAGFTVYGEIVGYTPEGQAIQPGYHYGCAVGQHKLLLYRATVTNNTGQVVELSWPQLIEFCAQYGFGMVPTYYHGRAEEMDLLLTFTPDGETLEEWQQRFLKYLEAELAYDQMCPYNDNDVPAEGVVVRVDHLSSADAFKLKNFKFLEWETKSLDKGEVDIETAEAEPVEEEAVAG